MNDDVPFEAFPFDFDEFDFAGLPPIAGGAPAPWDWVWDRIRDLGGVGEFLFDWLRGAFTTVAEWLWTWLGGGLRWVWDQVFHRVGDVWHWIWDWPGGLWEKLWGLHAEVFHWIWDWPEGVVRKLWDRVGDVWHWVWDWPGGLWEKVWSRVGDVGRWIWNVPGGLWERIWWRVDDVWHWVWDWPGGLWEKVWHRVGDVWDWLGTVSGGLWEKIWWRVDDVWHWVWDWPGGLWEKIWHRVGWVRDQVLPAVAGAAENIVGGLTAGFDKLGGILMGPFKFLADKILDALKWPFETAFGPFKDTFARKLAIPGKMVRGEYGSVRELVDEIADPPVIDNIVMAFGWGIVGIASLLFALMPALQPVNAKLIQDANIDFRPRLLGEGEILDAQLREIPISHGYDTHLERWGYRDEDIAALRTLRQPIPGSTDLIRMGVREVFTPEISEAFGQFEDFPARFGELMEMVGFGLRPTGAIAGGGPGGGHTWAEAFWAAHWDLPSVTQGFEMYHREVTLPDGSRFDEAQLMLLLRALDVMPNWRDPLRQIAYRVISRVDIRRIYQDGIVDEDKVREVYRHQGYRPEDADALTEMVKIRYPPGGKDEGPDLRELTLTRIKDAYFRRLIDRDEALDKLLDLKFPEEDAELVLSIWDFDLAWNPSLRFEVPFKDLSRSVITDAYRRGVFDFNRAAVELVEAGYTQDDAELLLQLEDLKLQSQLTDMEVDLILQEAQSQEITLAEAETRLLGLGIEPARVTFLIRREELRRMTKTRTLTASQIARAFRAGIFTEALFLQKLDALGYTADDAAVLLGLEGPVEQARRQLSRSEVERLLRRQEITAAEAVGRLTAMGYLAEDAGLIVGSVERQLERGLVERLLEQALLTRAEALDRLVKAGFSSADAELIVKSREQKMAEEAAEPEPEETPSRELSRTLVEKFLRERILTRDQALERLVRAGFTPGDAELIVASVERKLAEEAVPTLPPALYETREGRVRLATARQLFRDDRTSTAQLADALRILEMPESLVEALVDYEIARRWEAPPAPPPDLPEPRPLSRAVVERLFREGLLTREQALERLVRVGIAAGDAELIVTSVERKLAEEAAQE